jgi:hypothetical protein
MRLQAMYQARLLTHRYNILRSKITNLQRYCRRYLAKQNFQKKMNAILKIQCGVRKFIAQKAYRRLKDDVRKFERSISLRIYKYILTYIIDLSH